MVQIIENWTDIIGTVTEVRRAAGDFCVVRIDVERTEPVAGFPSLVGGETIDVAIRREDAERIGIVAGRRIRARVRLSGSGAFAHPDETHVS